MDKLITTLLNKLGTGWLGYAGGVVLLFGALGLGADFVGTYVGVDAIPGRETTWVEVTLVFGNALAALGIRRKQSNQDATIQAATVAAEEQTEASMELTEAIEDMPQAKGKK